MYMNMFNLSFFESLNLAMEGREMGINQDLTHPYSILDYPHTHLKGRLSCHVLGEGYGLRMAEVQ